MRTRLVLQGWAAEWLRVVHELRKLGPLAKFTPADRKTSQVNQALAELQRHNRVIMRLPGMPLHGAPLPGGPP
jgi:hypothetical protein